MDINAMNTAQYRSLDRQHLWHPYSRQSAMRDTAFPVIIRGEGVYLFDSDGRRYLDAISSWWGKRDGKYCRYILNGIVYIYNSTV